MAASATPTTPVPTSRPALLSSTIAETCSLAAFVSEGFYTEIAGQYGSLRIFASGDYTYEIPPGTSPGNVTEIFTYTLTDADGDSTTATLTIAIEDAVPNLPDPAVVLLDDDALAGGNPGGIDDNVDSEGTPGTLAGSGGDGALVL